ncbi:MAG: hypothetical protein IKO11_04700 [Lachnospiraceae bacterium]|nr:hypothetical protein [Lachnospiraceae bacterium]
MFQIDTRKIHMTTEALESCYRRQGRVVSELDEVCRQMSSDDYFPECAEELRLLIRQSEEEEEQLRSITETLYAIRGIYIRREEEIEDYAESGVKTDRSAYRKQGMLNPGTLPESYTKIEIV